MSDSRVDEDSLDATKASPMRCVVVNDHGKQAAVIGLGTLTARDGSLRERSVGMNEMPIAVNASTRMLDNDSSVMGIM